MKMVAYGATCKWWDDKEKVAVHPNGLPCCPHCSGVLFEMPEDEWLKAVKKHDEKFSGYGAFVHWLRGKCFPSYPEAIVAWSSRWFSRIEED